MKLDIQIDSSLSEEVIRISAPQMTEELQQVIDSVEKIYQQKKLKGRLDGDVYMIELADITQFVMEDKSVCAVMTTGERLRLEERLYQLEEWVDHRFVRISKSEIVNIDYINRLKMNPNGMIEIFTKSGIDTYSLRRYLKTIKERLEL